MGGVQPDTLPLEGSGTRKSKLDAGSPHKTPWPANKKYRVIYADPPWHFKTFSEKGTGRSALAHYDCMSFEELADLPVADFAAKACVLFLWVTDPMLPRGIELISRWGFKYKTVAFYWAKTTKHADLSGLSENDFPIGLGYWTRGNGEMCLLATRGKPTRQDKGVPELIIAPRRQHSRKPDEAYERIERLVPGPYIELFSRQSREGWDAWGKEAGLFDDGHRETRNRPSNMVRSREDETKQRELF